MAAGDRITISVIKADIGGWPGHSRVHPQLVEVAEEVLGRARKEGRIIDFYVATCGDDLQLITTHDKGTDSPEVHGLAWETFEEATGVAKELGLYGAGQDLLKDAFSGNIRGMGPGVAEMEITLRKSEPVVTFHMDKTEPGAFNLPLFRMFADPFNTAGLVIDPAMHMGFRFEVWDIMEHRRVILRAPEELYDLLALIGAKSRYVIKRVFPKEGHRIAKDEPVAVVSTEKLYQIAGEYVGKDDPVAIVRAQSGLPALGEVLEPFAFPHLVSGWMRGSHNGPIMPVPMRMANPTRFDGPPRVVALGWQISPEGTLVGPVDLFDDPAFDEARRKALEIADYMRRHGPFEPHRLPMEDMEYTTLPGVLERLGDRFEPIE
ncbi:fructose 1,6-bisphosphatase [Thermococcus sp. P6]|uniref:fructose-1,6-bisphosphate aldolase/phosphatase n=1 Tax=Thermococcus sp. P6 TaxID=122420 RepID=UPI000B59C491|nr:fructose-1,6-bisphosphate aldolase/phosphatase [Thermococcus sp. P6]ASJ10539.1 fructose 1,6-bisphosphatase [Thermococcus sp. P6]